MLLRTHTGAAESLVSPGLTLSRKRARQLRSQLHAAGVRVTEHRLSALFVLSAAQSPLSHGELCEELGVHLNQRATVFRNLQDLVSAGVLRRTDLGDHLWRYELNYVGRTAERAPVFVCRQCGRVARVAGAAVSVKTGRSAPRAVRKGMFEVHLRGLCDECVSLA